jgi:2-dehydropantoate 2-reductase
MKIAVMGAGAVGSFFGGLLARGDDDVILIGRAAHVQKISEAGLLIRSIWGDMRIRVPATVEPQAVGPVDLVLLTVKSYDTAEAIDQATPLLRADTTVLSLQNGVDNIQKIDRVIGAGRTLGGVAYVGVSMEEPGVIRHASAGELVIGEPDGSITPRVEQIAHAFSNAKVRVQISTNIAGRMWEKLLFNAAFNALTGLTHATVQEVLSDPVLTQLATAAALEVKTVADASGIVFERDPVVKTFELARRLGTFKTSTLQDLEAGKRTEVDAFNGVVAKTAEDVGVEAPVNRVLYGILSFIEAKPQNTARAS